MAPRLFSEMVPKSPNKTSKGAAGVMAKTPLDKKSRYFTGEFVIEEKQKDKARIWLSLAVLPNYQSRFRHGYNRMAKK